MSSLLIRSWFVRTPRARRGFCARPAVEAAKTPTSRHCFTGCGEIKNAAIRSARTEANRTMKWQRFISAARCDSVCATRGCRTLTPFKGAGLDSKPVRNFLEGVSRFSSHSESKPAPLKTTRVRHPALRALDSKELPISAARKAGSPKRVCLEIDPISA